MPKATPAEKISTISGSTTAHASLVRPSAFQLAVIRACSAFISAKLLLCAIPKPPAYHSLRERNRPARLYRQLKRRRLGSPLCTKEDTRISHLAAPFFAFVAPGFPPFCGGPDDFCREARHLSSPVPKTYRANRIVGSPLYVVRWTSLNPHFSAPRNRQNPPAAARAIAAAPFRSPALPRFSPPRST